jgi:Helicase conserved C-terminal domain
MGYEFPERNFKSPNLITSTQIANFQSKMEDYLRNAYASVESSINPSYEGSKGFVICVYQQRIASSLHSAELSLNRRRIKLEQIKLGVSQDLSLEDEDLLDESQEVEEIRDLPVESQLRIRVQNAAARELNYLNDLLDELRNLEGGTINGDPKITSLLKYLEEVSQNSKVIVFSRYTDTLHGIIKAFESTVNLSSKIAIGFYTGSEVWIRTTDGNKVVVTKKVLKQSLELGQISVIFCSDAASEGLNLQAANKLVNIDVPWNPGRLEQRIGRIARLGQRAKTVEIVNYWYPGSVESRMYSRLLERRDLYEMAIGPFPQIFSSAIRDSVLSGVNGTSDSRDPLLHLEELRDNLHRLALEDIWGSSHPRDSKSRKLVEELDAILVSIMESKKMFGLSNFNSESQNDSTGVLANPLWDELKVNRNEKDYWTSIFAIKSRNQFWYLAIQEGDSLIPIPSTSLPSLLKAAIGIKKIEIPAEWRSNSWKIDDRPKDSLGWDEDFLLIPKHNAFHPIIKAGLVDESYPFFDTEELQIEVVGQAWIGENNEG